jgi:hypothetical protein
VERWVHPVKVCILEAMVWLDSPLSPLDLERVFLARIPLSTISYHTRTLEQAGAIRKVGERQVRGSTQTFYAVVDG